MSRSSIWRQIEKKEQECSRCRRAIRQIRGELDKLSAWKEDWSVQKQSLGRWEITQSVVVAQVFEGCSAQEVQSRFTDGIGQKDRKEQQVDEVIQESENQIRILDDTICELEREIRWLYDELSDYDDED